MEIINYFNFSDLKSMTGKLEQLDENRICDKSLNLYSNLFWFFRKPIEFALIFLLFNFQLLDFMNYIPESTFNKFNFKISLKNKI